MTSLHLIKLIVLLKLIVGINCSSVLESNGTSGKDIDAKTLIALGRDINDPLITLIGRVIDQYHVCTEWSKWTECGAVRADYYSTTTRTRHCGVNRNEETQTNVCEGGWCPLTYDVTQNGFCIKLFNEKKNRSEAESLCKNDGGFLINIDSDEKYADVNAILTANDVQDEIHIDGQRKDTASQWEYKYGSGSGYFHWHSGYPASSSSRSCLFQTGKGVDASRLLTFNDECARIELFMCEFVIE